MGLQTGQGGRGGCSSWLHAWHKNCMFDPSKKLDSNLCVSSGHNVIQTRFHRYINLDLWAI